jgi:hypothetical protein
VPPVEREQAASGHSKPIFDSTRKMSVRRSDLWQLKKLLVESAQISQPRKYG